MQLLTDPDLQILGKAGVLATTTIPGGNVNMSLWNEDTGTWESIGLEFVDAGAIINLPASIALTELAHRGSYENAYNGIDDLTVADEVVVWETPRWQELTVDHNTNTDWIANHSLFLT